MGRCEAVIKRRAVEGAKNMRKDSISRTSAKKTASRKQTITGSRLTATEKKRVSADLF